MEEDPRYDVTLTAASQALNGSLTLSVYSQRMFSSLRSLWAIPAQRQSTGPASGQRNNQAALLGDWLRPRLPFVCRKSSAWEMSLTTLLASSSLKCFRFWMCARMEPAWGGGGGRRRFHEEIRPQLHLTRWNPQAGRSGLPPRSFSKTK